MRRTVYKLFWAWNYDKEEEWLNEMANKGLALVAIGFCNYTFEDCVPGEYTVRLELLKNTPTHAESERYIKFVEETGVEYLGSIARWVYFRKKREQGEFDIYSDFDSRIAHLNRILTLLAILSFVNLSNGINNLCLYFGMNTIPSNIFLGGLCTTLGLWVGFGFIRIYLKKRKLQKDKQLFE